MGKETSSGEALKGFGGKKRGRERAGALVPLNQNHKVLGGGGGGLNRPKKRL